MIYLLKRFECAWTENQRFSQLTRELPFKVDLWRKCFIVIVRPKFRANTRFIFQWDAQEWMAVFWQWTLFCPTIHRYLLMLRCSGVEWLNGTDIEPGRCFLAQDLVRHKQKSDRHAKSARLHCDRDSEYIPYRPKPRAWWREVKAIVRSHLARLAKCILGQAIRTKTQAILGYIPRSLMRHLDLETFGQLVLNWHGLLSAYCGLFRNLARLAGRCFQGSGDARFLLDHVSDLAFRIVEGKPNVKIS